ncbi:COG3904 family protein [Pararhizobium mangrovi]|uniref:Periplasmic protein-like protein n=1 Tax=Pararhizobium mangrovi TaxID=2590452 RepID=A0A506TY72_9HYPH|nr:hypothetical protein [Pararhizobium mangrovi]TPW26138.1 hypothetical protein FJU11_16060 [Pararhizobium mangrovi]
MRAFARIDDGDLARWAFRILLVGAVAIVVLDYRDLRTETVPATPADPAQEQPILPPDVATDGEGNRNTRPAPEHDPRRDVTTSEDALNGPIRFDLTKDNVLRATGRIDHAAAERLKKELRERGEYVHTVDLDSPGGDLGAAIAMADTIREHELDTRVPKGALCASSCPLVLAGGVHRSVDDKSAVGVHQFYTATDAEQNPAQAIADAQITTARIVRHLTAMGVDPMIWADALTTPPRSLHYLTADEMATYHLTTDGTKPAVTTSSPS